MAKKKEPQKKKAQKKVSRIDPKSQLLKILTGLALLAVLALLALFTHNTNFWFAALILAMIRFPDYASPLEAIATSVKKLAAGQPAEPEPEPPAVVEPISPAPQPREMEV